jgi:hypothetical protein
VEGFRNPLDREVLRGCDRGARSVRRLPSPAGGRHRGTQPVHGRRLVGYLVTMSRAPRAPTDSPARSQCNSCARLQLALCGSKDRLLKFGKRGSVVDTILCSDGFGAPVAGRGDLRAAVPREGLSPVSPALRAPNRPSRRPPPCRCPAASRGADKRGRGPRQELRPSCAAVE